MDSRQIELVVVASLLTLVASGCGGDRVVINDTGEACLSTDGTWPEHMEGQTFEEGAELQVMVRFHTCLSSSCAVDREAECTADVEGDQIFITGRASYTDESGLGVGCTTDCSILEATCSAGALSAGTYTVWYGRETFPLEVPSTTGAYCIDVHG